MKSYLLGVDIGTQGVKAVLFDTNGNTVSNSFIPSKLHQPESCITEENADFQTESVCRTIYSCINESSINPKAVKALAIDGQMAGIIGIGEDGTAVTPYDSWLDTRCAPYIKQMEKLAGDEILKKTGNPPSFNHGPKKLWWKNERPKDFRKIHKFVQPGGYSAMRLCGLKGHDAFIDNTYLHFSGFADTKNSKWDEDLISTFSMDKEKLPRIVSPIKIIGEIIPEMAKKCGLLGSVVVAAGCGDTAASFLSCGAVEPGICVDVAGTASIFASTIKEYCADTKNRTLGCGASVVPGLWHPYAYVNGGGMNLEWFVREILDRKPDDPKRFSGLSKRLEQLSSTDPLFIPHMSGRVSPSQSHLRGTFTGLERIHDKKTLFIAIIESVALEYGIYRQLLLSMVKGLVLKELRITGGGDASRIWKEIKSGVLQIPVTSISRKQSAPLGAAIIAGCAAGIFSNPKEGADKWIKTGKSVTCPSKYFDHFEKRIRQYKHLLCMMDEFYIGKV